LSPVEHTAAVAGAPDARASGVNRARGAAAAAPEIIMAAIAPSAPHAPDRTIDRIDIEPPVRV
jgi:hypothetical protein